ncbi:methyltransferase domain-containing protein [Haloferula rosea]|uniref:Methyltransferase domain-containing protein n=1 Tax=Haloferula rosea TaxID=490093 RepID=A0A934VG14_9BACT|nr:methyltransferase domain-containing protein [Haloferula rosea]MBK1827150.1 methyltransferase domain-containing protein [Haloferula rosea]
MTDWDGRWRAGETPWDKGEAAPPLLEALEDAENGPFLRSARVLVPGCGSGHDVRALARVGAEVTGLDLSAKAIEVARGIKSVGGESYVCANLFDWQSEPFDAVWEHTCFCAIDPSDRGDYAEAVAGLIRPGGRLIGVFYLDPKDPDGGPPHGARKEEIARHLEPWFTLERGSVPTRAFPSRVGREWLATFVRCDGDRRVAVD